MDPDFNAGYCDHPGLPPNAIEITFDSEEVNGTYPPGTIYRLTCANGYRPNKYGSTCLPDARWRQGYRCAGNNITSFHALKNGLKLRNQYRGGGLGWLTKVQGLG